MPNDLSRSSAEAHAIVFERFCSSNTRAHMWWTLTTVKGESEAVKYRDIVAKRMTTEQETELQKLARRCQARNFKNCD